MDISLMNLKFACILEYVGMAKKMKKRFRIYEGNILMVALLKLLIVLILFFFSRVLFYIFNQHYFASLGTADVMRIFWIGIRFDISAIFIINLPFIFLNSIPFRIRFSRIFQVSADVYFYLVNMIGLLVNFVDLIYFRFTLKRLTADIFAYLTVGGDFGKLIPQFFRDFWYVPLLCFIFWILLVYLGTRFKVAVPRQKSAKIKGSVMIFQTLIFLVISFFSIIFIRGGFQLRPISIITAGNYTNAKNVPLVLNTPFSIINTIGREKLVTLKFFASEDKLGKIYTPLHKAHQGSPRKLNVMIIIMESFSREHIGFLNRNLENGNYRGFTPFLDSLAQYSLVLDAYANGKTSIQGIPAVLSGIPSLMDESYIQSTYSTNNISSLANLLKKEGYTSGFFHGGTNGTMGFDSYTKFAGFDHYYGRSEYNDEKDYDGKWGIRDEEFFQFAKKTIDGFNQPFLAAFFSLSSHHPYFVPAKYSGKFRKGKLKIQESIMYADQSLGKFFEAAKKMPWYKNTLFVITADHTSEGYYPYYQTGAGQYAIPIVFYMPGIKLSGKSGETSQQADIMPSVLDYLNFDRDFIAFGNSVFDTTAARFSVHYISGIYGLVKDGYLLEFNGTRTTAFYDLKRDNLQKINLRTKNLPVMNQLEKFLKAYLQQYNNRLIENRLTAE